MRAARTRGPEEDRGPVSRRWAGGARRGGGFSKIRVRRAAPPADSANALEARPAGAGLAGADLSCGCDRAVEADSGTAPRSTVFSARVQGLDGDIAQVRHPAEIGRAHV